MLNKNRIVKAEIYDNKGNIICEAQRLEFPKDFFATKDSEFVIFKSKKIRQVEVGSIVQAIFYYFNGMRVRYLTQIDLCTDFQVNIHVGSNYEVMEERRHSYKAITREPAQILQYTEGGTVTILPRPVLGMILNISVGGVFLATTLELESGVTALINFLDSKLEVMIEILRKQEVPPNAKLPPIGYGCKFLSLSMLQEETISRYIFSCQQKDKEKYLSTN